MRPHLLLAAALLAGASGSPVLAQSAVGQPAGSAPVLERIPPKPPPHQPSDPVCLVKPAPTGPKVERTIFTGALLDGTTGVTESGGVYVLRYAGDETIRYTIDVNDPGVASGLLRVYEATSDSYPVFDGGPSFRNASSTLKDAAWLSQFSTLVAHSHDATSVTLDYEDHVDGVHRRRHVFEIEGKALRIRVLDLDHDKSVPANYCGVALGTAQSVDQPSLVRMQGALANPIVHFANADQRFYCANVLDMLWSNASDWTLPEGASVVPGPDSVAFSYSTAGLYKPLTNGKLAAPLDDSFSIVVSSRIADVLVTNDAAPSPYREALQYRAALIFTGDSTPWADYQTEIAQLDSWGMRDLAVYFFSFWSSTDNGDATHYPAKDEAGYKALRADPLMQRLLVGEYTKYWRNWGDSPSFNWHEIPLDSTGAPKGTNIVESARLAHAKWECEELRDEYGSNLGYQDVLTYASPTKGIGTDDVDQNATSPWAKTLRDACVDRKRWLKIMQDVLDGPLLGEASIATQASNMEWLWFGYCDSVQRTINTGSLIPSKDLPTGVGPAPTQWPVIPEYEWRVAAEKQTNHGNAFYARFFSWNDAALFPPGPVPSFPLPEAAQDRYRAYSVTYGHGAFFQTNGPWLGGNDYMSPPDLLREYYLMLGLQDRFFASPVTSIRYQHGGIMKTFDQIMAETGTTASFVDARVRIELKSGLDILVNHSPTPWTPAGIPDAGFTIPEDGFYAYVENDPFVAFSGIPAGAPGRCDYANVPSRYEFFDGRGVVAGHGNISTTNNKLRVRNLAENRVIFENDLGAIVVQAGAQPATVRLVVTTAQDEVKLGERTSYRVTAFDALGYKRDVTSTTVVKSLNDGIATVTPGGAVMTHCVGTVKLVPEGPPGALLSAATLDVLP